MKTFILSLCKDKIKHSHLMEGKIVIDSCFTRLTSGVLVNITNQNNYFYVFCDQYVGYKGILGLVRKLGYMGLGILA